MNLSDLREALHDVLSECGPEGRPRLYRILRKMAEAAESGNVRAAALLLDRAFGATQANQIDAQQRHTIYIDAAPPRDAHPAERAADAGVAIVE